MAGRLSTTLSAKSFNWRSRWREKGDMMGDLVVPGDSAVDRADCVEMD
jgi:hypothetical protein